MYNDVTLIVTFLSIAARLSDSSKLKKKVAVGELELILLFTLL
jgi:hypothetical protein